MVRKIETILTKEMKKGTHFYNPMMKSNKRTIRYSDEVWTPTGIVDSIRFEDYIISREVDCQLINYDKYDSKTQNWLTRFNNIVLGQCKIKGMEFPNKNCAGCFFKKSQEPIIGMCVTCFECKITLSDFKSENGHNFHGNRNYYVVPKELVKKIEHLVPEEIGILIWVNSGLRMYKECAFKDISDDIKVKLLYNAMKKWCDGTQS